MRLGAYMTISACSRSSRYNKLKKRALQIFDRRGGWLSPPEWAVLAGFSPTRAAYSYLNRLYRFGLLERGVTVSGLICYRVSEKGRQRLAWLS
jgi:hypothetical protein